MFPAVLSPWFPEEEATEIQHKHGCLTVGTEEWLVVVLILEQRLQKNMTTQIIYNSFEPWHPWKV